MEPKLIWRYLVAQILDLIIVFTIGSLIITGYLSAKHLEMDQQVKYLLGAISALIWIAFYTVYLPYVTNGKTPMRALLKLGIDFPDKMSYGRIFMVSTIFLYCAPMVSFGISILINIFLVLFTNKATTLEQKFFSVKFYKIENGNEIKNFRGTDQEIEELKAIKQKKLHKTRNKRKK